jgi:N6-adenosine-specific RNA methylase IME4
VTTALLRYDQARTAVAACHRIDEAKDIADKARALEAYARQANDPEMECWVAEIRLRARRRVGELSAALESVQGRNLPNVAMPRHPGKREALAAAGLSKDEAHRCERIANVPEIEFERVLATAKEQKRAVTADDVVATVTRKQRRAERMETLAEVSRGNTPLAAIGQRFPLIYADPPWQYEHVKTESRAIENHYPTMTLDAIKALPVADVAHDDCVLFLWVTSPKLAEAVELVQAWGFVYRSCAVWDKGRVGMGYYFRQQHELLFVATTGAPPVPEPVNRPASVLRYPRGAHSAKPPEVYELIERMYPELGKLELFARAPRDGWSSWGNQSEAANA